MFLRGGVLIYEGRNERKAWRGGGDGSSRAPHSWIAGGETISRRSVETIRSRSIIQRLTCTGKTRMEAVSTFGSHQPNSRFESFWAWLQKDLPIRGTTVLSSARTFVLISLSLHSLSSTGRTICHRRAHPQKKKRKRIRRLPAWALVLGYPITRSALEQRRIPLTTPLRTRRASTERSLNPFHHSPPLGSPRGSTR